jgi:hypothetical protein
MPYGIGHQFRREQLRCVDQGDQTVQGQDQAEGTATDGDGAGVVGDVKGVLPAFALVFGHAATPVQ